MVPLRLIVSFLIVIWGTQLVVAASEWLERECRLDRQCIGMYKPGSQCLEEGKCSNPYMAGCLNNYYMDTTDPVIEFPKRTCNSNDNTTEKCEPSILNYPEVRVQNPDWEAGIFYAWIIQIFLSEFLQVPTTVGLLEDAAQTSFYAQDMLMMYSSKPYAWEELEEAHSVGGRCDMTDKDCIHAPEVWNGQRPFWQKKLVEGQINQLNGNGEIGKISWYIPLYTAQKYPGPVSYHGMKGKRQRLASIFNRPTTWQEYCKFHSPTNCTMDDGVAV